MLPPDGGKSAFVLAFRQEWVPARGLGLHRREYYLTPLRPDNDLVDGRGDALPARPSQVHKNLSRSGASNDLVKLTVRSGGGVG